MPKGFDLRCGQGRPRGCGCRERWALKPGRAFALLPLTEGETERSPAGFIAPLRKALIEGNRRHVNVFVSEEDYRTLKRDREFGAGGAATRRVNNWASCERLL